MRTGTGKYPPRMIMSLNRPVIVQYPSGVNNASSPVFNQIRPSLSVISVSPVFFVLFQYPLVSWYPAMQSSPRWPTGAVLPLASMILALAWGMTLPTVVRRVSMLSVVRALKQVGEASVRPVTSVNCRFYSGWPKKLTIAAGILRHVQFPQ